MPRFCRDFIPCPIGNWMMVSVLFLLVVLSSVSSASSLDFVDSFAPSLHNSESLNTGAILDTKFSDIQFDNYSLSVKGQRIFLYSGEFHTYRLPVPSLWPDILQKVKAAGLNGISVYLHMGAINPARNVIDFESYRALQPLYDAAREVGVFVTLRPGPYINAETSAGGQAHWITTEIAGTLRTNDTDWHEAWLPYIQGVINQTLRNQVDKGGPVIAIQIDNEFIQNVSAGYAEYFAQLEATYRAAGSSVPLIYNDAGEGLDFINGTGAVDLYGMDAYPVGFDCSDPTLWVRPLMTNWHQYHEQNNPSQPWYSPEFQGGSSDSWGGAGEENCREMTGPNFQSVFNRHMWASNAKLMNFYMTYGGTSWGAISFPGGYTSYDYGASIQENRLLSIKYDELKRQALFLRSSPDFYKTEWIGDPSTGLNLSSNPDVFVTFLQNPDTQSSYYIARQANVNLTTVATFKLNVAVSGTDIQIPTIASTIALNGRQSKMIVSNTRFGSSSRLFYSTASIFFSGVIDGRDVLFVFGDSDQEHEFAVALDSVGNPPSPTSSSIRFTTGHSPVDGTTVTVRTGFTGLATVWDSPKQLILFSDTQTAATFWAPVIAGNSNDPFRQYWSIGSNTTILVGGPYLVRNASISGSTLNLRGDLNTSSQLTVVASAQIKSVTWNGRKVPQDSVGSKSVTSRGGFVGRLNLTTSLKVIAPKLSWKFKDSLPEIQTGFDDSDWTTANHTTTNIPFKPFYGDGRILYGCDYGFCENVVIWRGHFKATGDERSVNLTINGGTAFAGSVWLNDVFLDTSFGSPSLSDSSEVDATFTFPDGAILSGKDNVITIVQDNMGLDETFASAATGTFRDTNQSKSPRGIRGFKLSSGNFTEWKVQGKIGGYKEFPDRVRGLYNEGGLFGERAGWHLPGFDTSAWESRDISDGLPNSVAGVGFFVANFDLHIEEGLDVPMSFTFAEEFGQPYRALLFVNGWQMGKRIGNLGPQATFPVHQGILDYSGTNTVAIALWATQPNVTVRPIINFTVDGQLEGGVGGIVTNNPSWTALRKP